MLNHLQYNLIAQSGAKRDVICTRYQHMDEIQKCRNSRAIPLPILGLFMKNITVYLYTKGRSMAYLECICDNPLVDVV